MAHKRPTAKLVQAMQGRGRRSPLYWWMRDNYAELAAAYRGRTGRADWKTAVAEFARLGLTDFKGKPPSADTARKTWARVLHDTGNVGESNEPEERLPGKSAQPDPEKPAANPYGFVLSKPK